MWRIGDIVEDAHRQATQVVGPESWFIIYTGGASETRCQAALALRGWESYIPMRGEWRIIRSRGRLRADRTKGTKAKSQRIEVPLFPGYLFVQSRRIAGEVETLLFVHRVADVIRRGTGDPVRLFADDIADLRQREGQPDTVQAARPKPLMLKAGTAVRITRGPFASFDGTVEEGDDSGLVKVGVAVFGRTTPILLPLDDIEVLA